MAATYECIGMVTNVFVFMVLILIKPSSILETFNLVRKSEILNEVLIPMIKLSLTLSITSSWLKSNLKMSNYID